MPQVSLYIDKELLAKIESAAKRDQSSVSKWVQKRLRRSLDSTWPEGYFDVFGSLADVDIKRPPQGRPEDDVRRGRL